MEAEHAAAEIAADWDVVPSALLPEQQHEFTYLTRVCEHLGKPATAANVEYARSLLRRRNILVPAGDEFPKALNAPDVMGHIAAAKYPVGHPMAGLLVIFHNAEEEANYHHGQANMVVGAVAAADMPARRLAEAEAVAKNKAETDRRVAERAKQEKPVRGEPARRDPPQTPLEPFKYNKR